MVGDEDQAQPRMTLAEAAALDPDTHAGEVVGGRWAAVTRNTWMHAALVLRLGSKLEQWASQHPQWVVGVGDPGTKLGPDTLRGPDVGMLRRERFPTGTGVDGWLDGSPELVIEVKGDSQTFEALTRKVFEYLSAGALQVWVVNPGTETVVTFSANGSTRLFSLGDVIDAGALDGLGSFPGLTVPVAELFRR
ncbi:MAG: Uma2 family endonuclease [Myxococcaceae bacterium]|jgi:Uma2 family endonuclease|nr:Uma2 family endonuclease [Myxococcaceae bacterium]